MWAAEEQLHFDVLYMLLCRQLSVFDPLSYMSVCICLYLYVCVCKYVYVCVCVCVFEI